MAPMAPMAPIANVSTISCHATVEDSSGEIILELSRMRWVLLVAIRVRLLTSLPPSADMFDWKCSTDMHNSETPWVEKIRIHGFYYTRMLPTSIESAIPRHRPLPIGSKIELLIHGMYNHHLPTQIHPSLEERVAFLEENLDPSYPNIILMNLRRHQAETRLALTSSAGLCPPPSSLMSKENVDIEEDMESQPCDPNNSDNHKFQLIDEDNDKVDDVRGLFQNILVDR